MTTEKPKPPQRAYVVIRDPDTDEKAQCFTLYGATPKQVRERLTGTTDTPKRKRPEPAPA